MFSLCTQQKVYMNINGILSVASRLMETGHYAAQHIGGVAAKLDQVSDRGKFSHSTCFFSSSKGIHKLIQVLWQIHLNFIDYVPTCKIDIQWLLVSPLFFSSPGLEGVCSRLRWEIIGVGTVCYVPPESWTGVVWAPAFTMSIPSSVCLISFHL